VGFVLPSASGSNRSLANLEGKASRLGWFRSSGAFFRDRPLRW
jgi:hypothetical protein